MIKVLITGKDSHIGNKMQTWIEEHNPNGIFTVTQLDVVTDEWKSFDFSTVDVIVHVAAIVHRPDLKDWTLYKRVNADLPYEIAIRAKNAGVKQFVFFSTMAVYGRGKTLNDAPITKDTIPQPKSMYGKSKFMAENKLLPLDCDTFKIAIVRPPNVYGENGTLSYVDSFAKMLKILPVIPDAYRNIKQSMINIDNLNELIRLLILNSKSGVFMPQDGSAVSSMELMEAVCEAVGKKFRTSVFLGNIVKCFRFIPLVKKVYGGIAYSDELSKIDGVEYEVVTFKEGIKNSINK